MVRRASGDRFQLWPAARPFARVLVLALLPVPDLSSRLRVRRTAAGLVTCDPWPGMAATGSDAAQLALLRLLFLQRQTRKAVRNHQDEAAATLARVAIEILITGLYCLHEPDAVAQLQGEQMRMLPLLLEYLTDADVIPVDVLAECTRRLELGPAARGPSVQTMATRVDAATGTTMAISLYKRYYRPASNFAMHAGAASLLRHVRGDGHLARTPARMWGRRTPARIADACTGALTAILASRAGTPYQHAVRYADRHGDRALTPVAVMSLGGFTRTFRAGHTLAALRQLRSLGDYVQSGTDAEDPAARTAHIRADMQALLLAADPGIPLEALDPFLDYVAAKLAAEPAARSRDHAGTRSH